MTVLHHRTPVSVISNVKRVDDDGSVSSQLTVERIMRQKPVLPPRSSTVSFNLDQNIEYETANIFDDEASQLWYSKDDYKHFKSSFVFLAKQFQSYDRKNSDPQSFKATLIMAFNACSDATEDPRSCLLERRDEKALQQWLSKGSRRGIERISVLSIFADKSSRRKKITAAVLVTQDSCSEMSYEDRAACIRKVAKEISRPSRLFAWRLAF